MAFGLFLFPCFVNVAIYSNRKLECVILAYVKCVCFIFICDWSFFYFALILFGQVL